ncbi:helix-turn-helix transcriptional regulator [Paenibacillus sp. CGMCC 1.16610]|uniref:MarR family transcriptional regulator n=1 Tax=Paenibacillus anseongense TaxID=2682845 RepID=A0ABW9UFX0_9BACL|nr:helix-turn-helix transcriptional regulator [Paenibacillus sp. CGMCC 1.16610]MVQ38078.1 MarR family transcriptional regulator [Paenibacillus anseongense]
MKKTYNNQIEVVLDIIRGKWKSHIIFHLGSGPVRTGELIRLVTGVTQKMLIEQLKELEQDGLVSRKVYNQVPPKVEYSLTDYGSSLKDILKVVCDWGDDYVKRRYPDGEVTIRTNENNKDTKTDTNGNYDPLISQNQSL